MRLDALAAADSATASAIHNIDPLAWESTNLLGRFHVWNIKSKIPVPGSAIVNDLRRRARVQSSAEVDRSVTEATGTAMHDLDITLYVACDGVAALCRRSQLHSTSCRLGCVRERCGVCLPACVRSKAKKAMATLAMPPTDHDRMVNRAHDVARSAEKEVRVAVKSV